MNNSKSISLEIVRDAIEKCVNEAEKSSRAKNKSIVDSRRTEMEKEKRGYANLQSKQNDLQNGLLLLKKTTSQNAR